LPVKVGGLAKTGEAANTSKIAEVKAPEVKAPEASAAKPRNAPA